MALVTLSLQGASMLSVVSQHVFVLDLLEVRTLLTKI